VCRCWSNACNPLAPRIDKNLGNPVVKKVWGPYACGSKRDTSFIRQQPIHIQVPSWYNLLVCKLINWWVGLGLISVVREGLGLIYVVRDKEACHSFAYVFMLTILVHALWVSTLEISQTSLGIHPKPKTSHCDYLLDHNLSWAWMIFRQIFWRFSGNISGHITCGGTHQCNFDMEDVLKISNDLYRNTRILYFSSNHRSPHFYARGWAII
jgi:hypothetical protein